MLDLKKRGTSILLNSHLLSEVELVCDSIAIINKGVILRQGNLDEILEGCMNLEAVAENISDEIIEALSAIDPNVEFKNNCIRMRVNNKESVSDAAALIVQNGGQLYGLTHKHQSLENLFIQLLEEGDRQCLK